MFGRYQKRFAQEIENIRASMTAEVEHLRGNAEVYSLRYKTQAAEIEKLKADLAAEVAKRDAVKTEAEEAQYQEDLNKMESVLRESVEEEATRLNDSLVGKEINLEAKTSSHNTLLITGKYLGIRDLAGRKYIEVEGLRYYTGAGSWTDESTLSSTTLAKSRSGYVALDDVVAIAIDMLPTKE